MKMNKENLKWFHSTKSYLRGIPRHGRMLMTELSQLPATGVVLAIRLRDAK